MAETRRAIERQLEDIEVRPFTVEGVYRRRARKARNRRISAFVLVALILLGVAVSGAAIWSSADRTRPAAHPLPVTGSDVPTTDYLLDLDTGQATGLPESIAPRPRMSGSFAVSPDATQVAYERPAYWGQIFVANIDGTNVHRITRGTPPMQFPAWSPDGLRVAYDRTTANGVRNIFVFDVATGRTTQLTHLTRASSKYPRASSPHFTPDGASVLYTLHVGKWPWVEYSVPVTGGKSVPVLRSGMGWIKHLDGVPQGLSPDGSQLAVACCDAVLIGKSDGTDMQTVTAPGYFTQPSWSPDGTRIAYANVEAGEVFVLDVASHETTFVADGQTPVWLDDHTLIIDELSG